VRSVAGGQHIRGEFLLSDQQSTDDYEIVRAMREVLPIMPCTHTAKTNNYETVRKVMRVIGEKYSDPHLNLGHVARELPMSPINLSRILNQQVGVTFRQLLRRTRIEEAKRMLGSGRYSVKEVAASVGFSDGHYFSRSFKELTGLSASEYRSQDAVFG
jgi:YesN/AraC family two-component response regulator